MFQHAFPKKETSSSIKFFPLVKEKNLNIALRENKRYFTSAFNEKCFRFLGSRGYERIMIVRE